MAQSLAGMPPLWFWSTEIADVLLASLQPTPHLRQDTELLSYLPFVPGIKELLMLRQVHALEHATVWVLSDRARRVSPAFQSESLSGLSTDRGFYLYGQVDLDELRHAAQAALQRITAGDWDLAVHPRCGTNLSVGVVMLTGLMLGTATLLPRDPLAQILGIGAAATLTAQLAPSLGNLAQKYLTTAIPFNLAIDRVIEVPHAFKHPARFVQVSWID